MFCLERPFVGHEGLKVNFLFDAFSKRSQCINNRKFHAEESSWRFATKRANGSLPKWNERTAGTRGVSKLLFSEEVFVESKYNITQRGQTSCFPGKSLLNENFSITHLKQFR